MKHSPEIEFAIAEILASDDLMLVNDLLPERGNIRNETGNVLIRGEARGKQQIYCSHSIIVDTSIDAGIGKPCRIHAEGDVIITGSASNIHISARSIHIGGDARYCQLKSLRNTVVEGDLLETQTVLGDLSCCKHQINLHDTRLRQLIEQREILDRGIQRKSSHLHKACQSPRFNLNLAVGRLIQHDSKGLRVDLGFFYQQINKDKEEDIQAALVEFFNRGVIGVLGRTNRRYYIDSPANERVFIKTLADLRKIVLRVRQRDIQVKKVNAELAATSALIEQLADPRRHLRAQGRLSVGSSVSFSEASMQIAADGRVTVDNLATTLKVKDAPGGLELHHQHPNGHNSRTATTAEALSGIYVGLDAETQEAAPCIRLLPLKTKNAMAPRPVLPTSNPLPPLPSAPLLLVVSDSPFIADFATDELRKNGYDQVLVVENGYIALDVLREKRATIAFFDLSTPGVDGDAFLQVVRATKNGGELSIVLVARNEQEQEAIEGLDNGADEYLLKPLNIDALLACIERLSKRASQQV